MPFERKDKNESNRWKLARGLALGAFIALGVVVYLLDIQINRLSLHVCREPLKIAFYIASFFAIRALDPLTYFIHNRLSRK